MPKTDKYRALYVLKYLMDNTDEEHSASLNDIVAYLQELGFAPHPRTVDEDIKALTEMGYNIVCYRSTQKRFFIADRDFELPELKMIIDAIQAANFIPLEKSEKLIHKVASIASKGQAAELKRNLYVNKQKEENNQILLVVDQINYAINQNKQITFQYYEYDKNGKLVLKYDGYTYKLSPYALVWNVDNYYVIGYNEKYGKAIKYRVDKMCKLNVEDKERLPLPENFDLSEYVESMFLMYGEQKKDVTLRCAYSVIGKVIDRFGNDITINPVSDDEFEITETVAVGSTFFSWLFNYAGKIKIVAPEEVKAEFFALIKKFDENE